MTGLFLLGIALSTILLSPIMLRIARASRWMPFPRFALVGVGGIAAPHLLPEAFESGARGRRLFLLGFLPPLGSVLPIVEQKIRRSYSLSVGSCLHAH